MKTKIIYFTLIAFSCFTSCKGFTQSHTTKIIETLHYAPIMRGDNWVCGEEINNIHYVHTIIHYDTYGNDILEKHINKKNETYKVITKEYFSPEEKKLKEITIEYPNSGEIEKKYYIRDQDGKLIEIQREGSYHDYATSYEYDEQGRRTKVIEGNLTTYLTYIENQSVYICQYEKYDSDCEYTYRFKEGIKESGVSIYDKKTDLLIRKNIEMYKYGCLGEIWDIEYSYNNNGELISAFGKGKRRKTVVQIPLDLSFEEKEAYIKEHTYSEPIPPEDTNFKQNWEYNEHGDCIKKSCIDFEPSRISSNETIYKYEYNERGDWTKCLVFKKRDEYPKIFPEQNDNEPSMIIIRTIQYL